VLENVLHLAWSQTSVDGSDDGPSSQNTVVCVCPTCQSKCRMRINRQVSPAIIGLHKAINTLIVVERLLHSPIGCNDSDSISGLDTSLNECICQILRTLGPGLEGICRGLLYIWVNKGDLVRVNLGSAEEEHEWVLETRQLVSLSS
jgi:hypothetical protein